MGVKKTSDALGRFLKHFKNLDEQIIQQNLTESKARQQALQGSAAVAASRARRSGKDISLASGPRSFSRAYIDGPLPDPVTKKGSSMLK